MAADMIRKLALITALGVLGCVRSRASSRTDRRCRPVTRSEIERVFRREYGRAVAVLARVFGDIDLAEEAVQEAFATAVARWPESGMPPAPAGWIITTARNRAIDRLRREALRDDFEATSAGRSRLEAGLATTRAGGSMPSQRGRRACPDARTPAEPPLDVAARKAIAPARGGCDLAWRRESLPADQARAAGARRSQAQILSPRLHKKPVNKPLLVTRGRLRKRHGSD